MIVNNQKNIQSPRTTPTTSLRINPTKEKRPSQPPKIIKRPIAQPLPPSHQPPSHSAPSELSTSSPHTILPLPTTPSPTKHFYKTASRPHHYRYTTTRPACSVAQQNPAVFPSRTKAELCTLGARNDIIGARDRQLWCKDTGGVEILRMGCVLYGMDVVCVDWACLCCVGV
jgi:hypothetical protein